MRFEDKRILRQVMRDLDLAQKSLADFDFGRAKAGLTAAQWLIGKLATNVRLNEVGEEEEQHPYVLHA